MRPYSVTNQGIISQNRNQQHLEEQRLIMPLQRNTPAGCD
jgi:hypothetical protein